jgi:hypothetical protein
MKIEIFDIDGTLTYVFGDIPDTTKLKTYSFWPLITERFTKDINILNEMVLAWEESMLTEEDPTGSSHRMMQAGVETFREDVKADDIRQYAKSITLEFINHGVIRKEAIEYLQNRIQNGIVCVLSTGSYQEGAMGFVDALIEKGLLRLEEESNNMLRVTGALVDWATRTLTHANVRERKLIGIEKVMGQSLNILKPDIEAVYGDDPWINDKDILTLVSKERAYVIRTAKNKDKTLPNGLLHTTWESIIEKSPIYVSSTDELADKIVFRL